MRERHHGCHAEAWWKGVSHGTSDFYSPLGSNKDLHTWESASVPDPLGKSNSLLTHIPSHLLGKGRLDAFGLQAGSVLRVQLAHYHVPP